MNNIPILFKKAGSGNSNLSIARFKWELTSKELAEAFFYQEGRVDSNAGKMQKCRISRPLLFLFLHHVCSLYVMYYTQATIWI